MEQKWEEPTSMTNLIIFFLPEAEMIPGYDLANGEL